MPGDGDVAAIVLAAGQGVRFGAQAKLLAKLHGKPLVRHAVETALESGAAPVLVVVGHRGPEIAEALAGLPVRLVDNPDFAEGLSTSLKAGFAALPATAAAAVILLGDMPMVRSDLVDDLIKAWRENHGSIAVVPVHDGARGNPVLLSRVLAAEIAALSGDNGAGPILRDRAGVLEWPVGSASVSIDVDTPDALAQAARARTTPPSTAE